MGTELADVARDLRRRLDQQYDTLQGTSKATDLANEGKVSKKRVSLRRQGREGVLLFKMKVRPISISILQEENGVRCSFWDEKERCLFCQVRIGRCFRVFFRLFKGSGARLCSCVITIEVTQRSGPFLFRNVSLEGSVTVNCMTFQFNLFNLNQKSKKSNDKM